MSEQDANQSNSLNNQWKKRLKELGQGAFEFEEMIRLGFIDLDDIKGVDKKMTIEESKEVFEELAKINSELLEVDKEIDSINQIEELLAEIRSRRIKRVKEAAKEKKIKKQEEKIKRSKEIKKRKINSPTFLGRGVSNRLTFITDKKVDFKSNKIPELNSFVDVANALELTPSKLQWLIYERGASNIDHYLRYEIPKKSGGKRLISSPKKDMKKAQKWILENILIHLDVDKAAMAFQKGLSIIDNASLHVKSKIVVRIDIKDFFPTITFPRVRGFFESLGYNPGVATVFALICTDSPKVILKQEAIDGEKNNKDYPQFIVISERSLPQGACTSPSLANLICRKIDSRLNGYSSKSGWKYSRYADDLIFSTTSEDSYPHRLIKSISSIISEEGFKVNQSKTRLMRAPNRQTVTGLVVNNEVTLSRRDLKRMRAFFHQCSSKGLDFMSEKIGKDALSVARGYISYVEMVSPTIAEKFRSTNSWVK